MKHIKLLESFSSLYRKNMLDEDVSQWSTPEKIRQAIATGGYEGRNDLAKKNSGLYYAALKNNMLDEFFNKQLTEWTPEKIRQAIKDGGYVGRTDLQKKNPVLYKAALRNKILDEFFDARTPTPGRIPSERTQWTTEKIGEEIIAGDYKSKTDLANRNSKLYQAALKYNVLYDFFDAAGNRIKWTPEKIRQAIADGGYESRHDLQKKNPNLYLAVYRGNMFDEFFDARKWTPEKIRQTIADGGYESRFDLRKKNRKLYQAALRNNMLGDLFNKGN